MMEIWPNEVCDMCPIEGKAQQGSAWAVDLKSAAKEGGKQREVRQTFKMLREIWLNIGVEKIDMHKRVTIKALLDSGMTGMFMDKKIAVKQRFKLQKLERPIIVRNVNGTNNSGEAIVRVTRAQDSRRILR